MTAPEIDPSSLPPEVADYLRALERRFGVGQQLLLEFEAKIDALSAEYIRAGGEIRRDVEDDRAAIHAARVEAELIAGQLRGTELAARYAEDAQRNLRVSNAWRALAGIQLMGAAVGLAALAVLADVSAQTLAVLSVPALLTFGYAAIESSNHRRREFDRRRIALRVSAIEAYTSSRLKSNDADVRKGAEELFLDFMRKHFINPELDSNDMAYPSLSLSVVSFRERSTAGRPSVETAAGPPAVPSAGHVAPNTV